MEKIIDSDISGYQYKILTGDKIYYKCDPKLNKECNHRHCSYEHTGPCEYTSKKEYAMLMKKNKKIVKSIKHKK